jgi:eukaryotic-like serine/threonine-protein kinase
VSERLRNGDIWKKDLESGKETALTTTPFAEEYPAITGDGTKVAYASDIGKRGTYVLNVASGVSKKIREDWHRPVDWTSDGRWILGTYSARDRPNWSRIGLLEVFTLESLETLQDPEWQLHSPRLSPDERWIAFHSTNNPATRRIFVAPFLRGKTTDRSEWIGVTEGTGMDREPRWSPDGKLMYFTSERDGFRCLWGQRLNPARKNPVGLPFAVHHFHRSNLANRLSDSGLMGLSVSQDRIFISLEQLTGNIWMTKLN